MHDETIINRNFRNGLTIKLLARFTGESPNSVYGNFRQVDRHQGGVTVQLHGDRHGSTHWVPEHYSIAQLAKDYAAQGRENPSRDAYASLQAECAADVLGDMLSVELCIYLDNTLLAYDTIGTAYWDGWDQTLEQVVREAAKEYFNIRQLLRDAKLEAAQLAKRFGKIAG